VKRREFITLLGGAAAVTWPIAARAQQPAMPVIGFLFAGLSGAAGEHTEAVFRAALAENGYVEGQNVTIEYRYAEGLYDRLSELAADLVRRQVSVLVAIPNHASAFAAKNATATIPILFMVSDDPAKLGLVASLNRPGGNATGVNYFLSELVAKRMEVLRELLPAATRFSVLVNPNAATAESMTREATRAASVFGLEAQPVEAGDSHGLEVAFASLAANKTSAVLVLPDTLFATLRNQIVALAAHHGIPAIYTVREYVQAGGLISYGPSLTESYRQLGIYAARILKGTKPADLPVVQSTKIELVINLPTARALRIDVPPTLLARADEVIE